MVPSQTTGSTRFLFGHIASLSPWYTGIALLNTTTTAANVEVYAIESNGELVASASFTLAANTRRTALLSEFAPQVVSRAADGGWVFVRTTNNVPLLGFELFGHSVFPVLANVQGFPLFSTSSFTPPIGATSASGVTITQVTFTDGVGPKLVFKPLDSITYVANLTNSSGATGTAQFTFTLIDPLNQTLFTAPLSIALPVGGGDVVFRSYIPSNALTGSYTVVGRLTIQGKTAAKANSFEVTGGASAPTAGQDPPLTFSGSGEPQYVYRPGELVRFLIPTANFTGQAAPATVNYQLAGPGGSSGGSGTLTFTILPGLSAQIVDTLTAPSPTRQSLYALTSTLIAGGITSTKSSPITVAPKSSAEAYQCGQRVCRGRWRHPPWWLRARQRGGPLYLESQLLSDNYPRNLAILGDGAKCILRFRTALKHQRIYGRYIRFTSIALEFRRSSRRLQISRRHHVSGHQQFHKDIEPRHHFCSGSDSCSSQANDHRHAPLRHGRQSYRSAVL